MQHLPVNEIRNTLKKVLAENACCVIYAPAGSGKSTLIPQFLVDDNLVGQKRVLILQPRKIPARMLANFIAKQRNSSPGAEVGYKVRLEGSFSNNTKILFVTEGILLNRLLQNDQLEDTGAIVFDEFHERHLETDLSLALALQLQQQRRHDIKIIIMSATLDIDQLKDMLGPNLPVIESTGRSFPIDIFYKQTPANEPIWENATRQVETYMKEMPEGSALVFMPGAFEIRKTIEALNKRNALASFGIHALHGQLSKEEQDKALQENGRKIIVSTNVAETSLTIPSVRLVIDSGMARVPRFDPKRGINTIFIENISLSSADQRAGRAGRVAPGICVRLWSEFENEHRVRKPMPEIHRVDLSESILGIISIGYTNPFEFPWIEKPAEISINNALTLLKNLEAIDDSGITKLGKEMATLNVHPRFARMLVHAKEKNCFPSACLLVALEQSNGLLNRNKEIEILNEQEFTFGNPSSDLLFELNAWIWAKQRNFDIKACSALGININVARQIEPLARQLLVKTNSKNPAFPDSLISPEEIFNLRECIFVGFIDFLAVKHKSNSPVCQMMFGKSGKINPNSIVQNVRFMVATELEESKKNNNTQLFLNKLTEVEEEWLQKLTSQNVTIQIEIHFNDHLQRVVETEKHIFNDLVIYQDTRETKDIDKASSILTDLILKGQVPFDPWNEDIEHFIRRANFAAHNASHYEIPIIDEEAKHFIIQQSVYKCRSIKDLEKCNVWPAIKSWFSKEQLVAIDYLAPIAVDLPKRKHPVKLRYDEKGDAVLSETVQGLYDCLPVMICEGKVQVVYEILAPSRRPVQITRDLENFWRTSYLDVRKELKGRYPKHEWR